MSTTAASSIHSPSSSQHSPTLTIASQPILLAPSNSLMLSLRPDKRKWQESFPDNSSKASKSPRHDPSDGDAKSPSDEYSSDDNSSVRPTSSSSVSSKPGRKPMSDDETYSVDADGDPKVKRKAQNRAAQRAFRERKERYVRDLEFKIKQVQDSFHYTTTQLMQENQHLRSIIHRLEAENFALKGGMYRQDTNNNISNNNDASSSSSLPHVTMTTAAAPSNNANDAALNNMLDMPGTSHNLPSPTHSCVDYFCYQTSSSNAAGSDVIERILSEPLFDDHGSLNLHIPDSLAAASVAWSESSSSSSNSSILQPSAASSF